MCAHSITSNYTWNIVRRFVFLVLEPFRIAGILSFVLIVSQRSSIVWWVTSEHVGVESFFFCRAGQSLGMTLVLYDYNSIVVDWHRQLVKEYRRKLLDKCKIRMCGKIHLSYDSERLNPKKSKVEGLNVDNRPTVKKLALPMVWSGTGPLVDYE